MMQKIPVYLDHNATTFLRPEARARMVEVMEQPCNPSSVHRYGRAARAGVEQARTRIAEALSVFPREIIFTSSGTEANNWVLRNTQAKKIFIGATEHSSVQKGRDGEVSRIPVGADGVLKLDALEAMLKGAGEEPVLVSVMLGNNETGVIHPVAEVAALCRQYNALYHCDVIQCVGKIPVDAGVIGADYLSISAHKCGGPIGAAALIVRGKAKIDPFLLGGGQEHGRRAGTENAAAIAAFGMALERSVAELPHIAQVENWMRHMEAEILKAAPETKIHGKNAPRLPNTCCISMPGVSGEIQLMDFDLCGFAVSAGSACTSGKAGPGHVLSAMGVSDDVATCAIRVSAGWNTTQEEIERFTAAWIKLYARNASQPAHMMGAGGL